MDPISNFTTQLKNAGQAGLESVSAPFSNLKMEIAELLKKEGYLTQVTKKGKKIKKVLYCELAYEGKEPRINDVERISKPSKRVYIGSKELSSVLRSNGIAVLSTPKGLMTAREARQQKVGGEFLFKVR